MARIIGNLAPEDDCTHAPGPEENYNESVYLNFFDPSARRGGFVRLGNRVNEGRAELTVMLWNPDGSAYFNYKRPEISHNDAWDAGGLLVDVLEPTERVRSHWQGKLLHLPDPSAMRDPGRAFREHAFVPVEIDLLHQAVGPFYGHVGEPGDGNEFARAHTEQHMRVAGTLRVGDGEELSFRGHGLRDHSWGPRYWQATPSYRWLTGNFGDDLGFVLTTNGDGEGRGVLQRGEELVKVERVALSAVYDEGTRNHRSFVAELILDGGTTHRLEGTVIGYIPLRNRRAGAQTHIGEGMTEYRLDGERVGYGLSEFLDNAG